MPLETQSGSGSDADHPRLAELCRELKSADAQTRIDTIVALGRFGAIAAPHLGELTRALEQRSAGAITCEWIAWAVGEIAEHADADALRDARSALCKLLDDSRESVRRASLVALMRIPNDDTCFARVQDAHANGEIDRRTFVRYLQLHASAFDAAFTLLAELQREHDLDAHDALAVLCKEDPQRFRAFIEKSPARDQDSLIEHLAQVAPASVADLLLSRTRSCDPAGRAIAVAGLGSTQPSADSKRALLDAFADPEASVRASACAHTGSEYFRDARIRAALLECVRDEQSSVRHESTLAIGRMLEADRGVHEILELLPDLIDRVGGKDAQLACYSIWVLERLGSLARPARRALVEVAAADDTILGQSALAALDSILDLPPDDREHGKDCRTESQRE